MNMKNTTKSICILFGMVAAVAVTAAVILVPQRQQAPKTDGPKTAVVVPGDETSDSDSQEVSAFSQDVKFVILKDGDYLTVYRGDYETVYAYTDIRYQGLSEELKERVSKGMAFEDEKTLYDFLENYSS